MNVKKILFYGGTGQSKVMRPIADVCGKLLVIVDDTEKLFPPFPDVDFYNGEKSYERWKQDEKKYKDFYFAITIGNPNGAVRQSLYKKLEMDGIIPINLIHKKSFIELYTKIGKGNQIHSFAIINPFAEVGDYCIINTRALIEHDCILSNGVEIGPGAILCGNVRVGENSWIGAGATIKQNINIGKNSIIGAGAVVIKNVPDNVIVVGVPAEVLRRIDE